MEPIRIENLNKLYYSIGEVAEMYGVNTSLIRFWEKEFDIIQPKKNKKGNRLFTIKDIENFNRIHHLVKEKGYTLEGAKNELKRKSTGVITDIPEESSAFSAQELIQRLETIRLRLLDLRK